MIVLTLLAFALVLQDPSPDEIGEAVARMAAADAANAAGEAADATAASDTAIDAARIADEAAYSAAAALGEAALDAELAGSDRDALVALAAGHMADDLMQLTADSYRCRVLGRALHDITAAQATALDASLFARSVLDIREVERAICADATIKPLVPDQPEHR